MTRKPSKQAICVGIAIEKLGESGKVQASDIKSVYDDTHDDEVNQDTAFSALLSMKGLGLVERPRDKGHTWYITDHARSIGAALMRPNKLDALESVALDGSNEEKDIETDGGVPTPPWETDDDSD